MHYHVTLVAERRERSQLLGDVARDIGTLVIVFWPLEEYVKLGLIPVMDFVASVVLGCIFIWWGIILEGRNES